MKKIYLLVLLTLGTVLGSKAQTFTGEGGVTYTIYVKGTYFAKVDSSPDATGAITIPSTVEYDGTSYPVDQISDNAFKGNNAITSVKIESGPSTIGDYAFQNCKSLTSITVPPSITQFGYGAFDGCSSMKAVYFTGDIAQWCGIESRNYNVNANPLSAAHNLYIEDELVTSLTIPDGVTTIASCAFINATCLQGDVVIPASVARINTAAFQGCTNLTGVKYQGTLEQWMKINFSGTAANPLIVAHDLYIDNQLVKTLQIPSSITKLLDRSFEGATCLEGGIVIPSTVTSVGTATFAKCSNITSVDLGSGLTSVGWNMFEDCTALKEVKGGSAVTKIDYYAFRRATGLETFVVPEKVTTINSYAFQNCTGLKEFTFNAACTTLGSQMFEGAPMVKMTSYAVNPPTASSSTFNAIPQTIPVYVPVESVDKYKSATGWKTFTIMPDGALAPEQIQIMLDGRVVETIDTHIDEPFRLQAVILPEGVEAEVSWYLHDNLGYVVINPIEDNMVEVTPKKIGSSQLTASVDDVKASVIINVLEVMPTALEVKTTEENASTQLMDGQTLSLSTVFTPANTTNKAVTWSVSDPDMAEVSEEGVVTAKAKTGEVTVTATSVSKESVQGSIQLTIIPTPVSEVTVQTVEEDASLDLMNGQTLALRANVSPETATNKAVTWTVSDDDMAEVSAEGVVTAKAKTGEVTVTATSVSNESVSGEIKLTIVATPVQSIEVTTLNPEASTTLMDGDKLQLQAIVFPATATNKAVTWSVSDDEMAEVSEEGIVTAKAKTGEVTVTATSVSDNNISGEIKLTIVATPVQSIEVTTLNPEASTTLRDGDTLQLQATVSPATATNKAVTWSVSDPDMAEVSEEGVVTAKSKTGEVTVTATSVSDNNINGNIKLTIEPTPVSLITLSNSNIELQASQTYTLNAQVSPSNATFTELIWSSDNETVATVSQEGVVTAIALGEAEVKVASVQYPDVYAVCKVKVIETPVETVTISLPEGASTEMRYGDTLQLSVTITPSDATYKDVTWTSSDNSIASVDSNGLVTAQAALGDAVITASTANGLTAQLSVSNLPFLLIYMLDEEEYEVQKYGYGATVEAPEVEEKVGYTFSGWADLPETMPAEDLTVYGSYEVNYYIASFYLNNELFDEYEVAYGADIPVPDVQTIGDYVFSGWTPEVPETMPAEDMSFYGSLTSGIGELGVDGNSLVTVYTTTGLLVAKDIPMNEVKTKLASGIYIIVGETGSRVIRF